MAEYNINKFSYGGNTYKVEDNRINSNSTGTVITAELLNIFYPVGTIYQTTLDPETFNPNNYWGGTWIRIEDRFLLAAGSTYTNGDEDGQAEVTLTAAQSGMRAHTHTTGTHYHTLSSHTHGSGSLATSSDSHSHNTYYVEAKTSTTGSTRRFGPFGSSASGATAITTNSDSHSHSVNSGSTGTPSANYTSTAYNTTSGTGTPNTGGVNSISGADAIDPHDNMPPYVVVTVWKRTA